MYTVFYGLLLVYSLTKPEKLDYIDSLHCPNTMPHIPGLRNRYADFTGSSAPLWYTKTASSQPTTVTTATSSKQLSAPNGISKALPPGKKSRPAASYSAPLPLSAAIACTARGMFRSAESCYVSSRPRVIRPFSRIMLCVDKVRTMWESIGGAEEDGVRTREVWGARTGYNVSPSPDVTLDSLIDFGGTIGPTRRLGDLVSTIDGDHGYIYA